MDYLNANLNLDGSHMKKLMIISLAALLTMQCGGAKNVKSADMGGVDAIIAQLNKQLASSSLKNFPNREHEIDAPSASKWAKSTAPLVKDALDKLPPGYAIQVTGHTDPKGGYKYNMALSDRRAKFIHGILKKEGVKSKNLTYKGVGYSQMENTKDKFSGQNRSVTFQVVEN